MRGIVWCRYLWWSGTATTCRWAPICTSGASYAGAPRRWNRRSFSPITSSPRSRKPATFPARSVSRATSILRLLDNSVGEIARNGLTKILLVNAHGGNQNLLRFFHELQLYKPRDYVVYLVQSFAPRNGVVEVPWDPSGDLHAGAGETSLMLAAQPDLVHMERVPASAEGTALGRLQALRDAGVHTGIWWYADHPTHYAATRGRRLRRPANACSRPWPRPWPRRCARLKPTA